jgi:hypothetical protein
MRKAIRHVERSKHMERTYLRIEIMNRIGKINGRTCAVGNDYVAVRYSSDGRRMNVIKHFAEDGFACAAYCELWNGPELDAQVNTSWTALEARAARKLMVG